MLHLKRASAGSGKTYELAKTYIKLLLSVKEPERARRLRHDDALRESLSSIMAVTFTVKATAEMKQRIVEKLAALAAADTVPESEISGIDYLEEFIKDFRTTKDELAMLAKSALKTLLLHYSDFKVQTIDSFFQSILHTFAYEASLDENFNMEIDADYIASVGFDAALDSLSTRQGEDQYDHETLYWLKKMMSNSQTSNQWNVFARNDNNKSLYSELIRQAKNLEKEDFRQKMSLLTRYFQELEEPFRKIIEKVEEANIAPWATLHSNRRRAAENLKEELDRMHLTVKDLFGGPTGVFAKSMEEFYVKKLKTKDYVTAPRQPKSTDGDGFLSAAGKQNIKRNLSKYGDLNPSMINDLRSAYEDWLNESLAYKKDFCDPVKRKQLFTWLAYSDLLPELMVVMEISRKKRDYLEATNTLEISDTTHILSRIIGEDETPFIYERMGSRLNHYLIDEFQDTSRMQWHNLLPLLNESESRDEDNLIIGDAKQSIYRFRNADYRLITDEVEKQFRNVVPYTSDTPPANPERENTNYRSKARIVKFNNYVFSEIVGLQDENGEDIFSKEIQKIYTDSTQAIPKKKLEQNAGFVDVVLYPKLKEEEKENYEEVGFVSMAEPGFRQLPGLIGELKSRGYDYKDIGVLVSTHDQGKAVVKTIAVHNSLFPEARIPIISEENLLVASSLSVKIIIHALEIAVKGLSNVVPENSVLEEPVDEEQLYELLGSLQSQALPSVVEAILDKFVPAVRRNEDAPFIAAFQDAVLDYCAGHTSDIGTFLKWWQRKAKALAISSPEDSDGVKIDTIHGAKGLEYKCVIIPLANINFVPGPLKKEWKWVRPDSCVACCEDLPPYLPVNTTKMLLETAHSPIWEKYCEEVALDELNKMYVGFTRAVDELYVYAPLYKNPQKTAAGVLQRLLSDGKIPTGDSEMEEIEVVTPARDLGDGSIEFLYGKPLSEAEVAAEKDKGNSGVELIDVYNVCSDRRLLRFEDGSKLLQPVVVTDDDEEEDTDPRAEGTLKHRIMQLIDLPEDLDKALLELKVSGLVPEETVEKWGDELRNAVSEVADRGWFSREVRVVNERNILQKGKMYIRPDRIIIRPDGRAEIIDYKFGAPRSKYRKQLLDYAERLASTGLFRAVDAFLWYVPSGTIEKVTG